MDADEDLSASTYTFESSPTGPSASVIAGSSAFTPRGVGRTTYGTPSALSILLSRKQEPLHGEHVSSETGREGATTSEYPISPMSLTPTNERQGNAYFSSAAADALRRLESEMGSHPTSLGQEVNPALPDPSQQVADETTSLLRSDRATAPNEDVNNGSRPLFTVTKTPRQHVKSVIPSNYGSIPALSKPSETFRRILDREIGKKAVKAIPAVVLGTLLNILDGISCTYFHSPSPHPDTQCLESLA